jgi:hypothetical protein
METFASGKWFLQEIAAKYPAAPAPIIAIFICFLFDFFMVRWNPYNTL